MQPKVNILLSVYHPNEKFLKEQLDSLNAQTYENLEVLIYDDCISQRCDIEIFKHHLTRTKWRLLPYGEKNLGYVKAFETLVKASDGDYLAFCDQDDIWLETKIERCINELELSGSLLVASDRMIINQEGKIIAESARSLSKKPWDNWKSGDDIGKYNLFITYAVGMSIVLNGDFGRNIVPFSSCAGHDNWAILCACAEGKVSFVDEPLVKYRRHGKNVSGVLLNIHTKEDYLRERVCPHAGIVQDFKRRYPENKDIPELEAFCNARMHHNILKIFKYRYLSREVAIFDIIVSLSPSFIFPFLVKIVQRLSS